MNEFMFLIGLFLIRQGKSGIVTVRGNDKPDASEGIRKIHLIL